MDRQKRVRKLITLETKKEIINKRENGKSIANLSVEYGMAKSTICTILKNKEELKTVQVAKGIARLSKARCDVIEEMENLLLVWIKEKEMAGDSMSEAILCEKAKQLFEDLKAKAPSGSDSAVPVFKGTKGWFTGFRRRNKLHSVVRHGEAASADKDAAKKYHDTFLKVIQEGGFVSQQVFNADETGLFWKKMPRRTYITREETSVPGHKPMKDRLTLLLCANASGSCKIKPLLIYHSENPRAFKNIRKNRLGVMWRSNPKAWVTRSFFSEWVTEVFGPTVRDYLRENNLPLKALLVMDNAPAHPPKLMEELPEEFNFITVHFLPPNTTPLIQPMDQQVISNFKKLYTKALFRKCFEATSSSDVSLKDFWKSHFNIADAVFFIVSAWKEISVRCLCAAWRPLWPECVPPRDFEGFEELEGEAVVQEIVCLGNSMGLEVNEEDVEELVEEHRQELSTEELLELHNEEAETLKQSLVSEESGEDEDKEESHIIPAKLLKDAFSSWNTLSKIVKDYHPDVGAVEKGLSYFNDTVMAHFWKVQKSRLKQPTLESFFKKVEKDPTNELPSPKRARKDDSSPSTSSQ